MMVEGCWVVSEVEVLLDLMMGSIREKCSVMGCWIRGMGAEGRLWPAS